MPDPIARPLGTMITYGFARGHLETDLAIAARLGATVLEVLPDWRALPDPTALRGRLAGSGWTLHSAHGPWAGQAIRANRVDLANPDPGARLASVDDVRRSLDWLATAGGAFLVVHPGGLSDPDQAAARRAALAASLGTLADHAAGAGRVVCVENMPPGVHPGSRMADLAALLDELDQPGLALALDTGHAHLVGTTDGEARAAGSRLGTTHVHDNNRRQDTHLPPGYGTIAWESWLEVLDAIDYRGPVMLECIRHLREHPECLDPPLIDRLARLSTGR